MSTAQPTLDDIWRLFHETGRMIQELHASQQELQASQKETDRKFQETDRQFKETDLKFQETARRFKETDLKFQETARRFDETDRKFKETDLKFEETDRRFKETDLKFKETDRKFQETDRKLQETDRLLTAKFQETDRLFKEVGKKIGDLGNRLGDFVQEMVRPAVVRLFRERGVDVHEVHRNISVERGGESAEVDLLVVNDEEAVAVECKSRLSIEDVDEHLERLGKLKRLLPKYRDVRLMGAVAAMVMSDDAARYAYRRGLYVLAQSGDTVLIRNDAKFTPKLW